ncbi:MAG: F0F1 ATP synthase subunit A [Candidatus Woesearchaeota archaeon]
MNEYEQQEQVRYEFSIAGREIRFIEREQTEQSFMNNTLYEVNLLGTKIGITETIQNTWIIMGVLIVFALFIRLSIKKFNKIPSGVQNFVEFIVESFTNFTTSVMGKHNVKFAAFYMSMFLFILLANLSGLFALRPPTADIATTFALAITTFFMIHSFGIMSKGIVNYIKDFFKPMFLLFPINVIGELAVPVSLAFRLFGNILGGTIIMALVYSIPFWPMHAIGVPAILHAYFDLFAGLLQSFIFVMLSMTFVSNAIQEDESPIQA